MDPEDDLSILTSMSVEEYRRQREMWQQVWAEQQKYHSRTISPAVLHKTLKGLQASSSPTPVVSVDGDTPTSVLDHLTFAAELVGWLGEHLPEIEGACEYLNEVVERLEARDRSVDQRLVNAIYVLDHLRQQGRD